VFAALAKGRMRNEQKHFIISSANCLNASVILKVSADPINENQFSDITYNHYSNITATAPALL